MPAITSRPMIASQYRKLLSMRLAMQIVGATPLLTLVLLLMNLGAII